MTRRLAFALLSRGIVTASVLGGACAGLCAPHTALAQAADAAQVAPPQGAVRRLTEAQYRRSIADIFGPDIQVIGRFEPDIRKDGLIAVGAGAVSVTPGAFDKYDDLARGIADQVTNAAHRGQLIGCQPDANEAESARCATAAFEHIGLQLFRRPLQPGEAQNLAAEAIAGGRKLGDFYAGVSMTLAGMLASPEFLFRIDQGEQAAPLIDGYSKAARLSYLLWNTTPDAELLAAAGRGELDAPSGLSLQVDRLLASPLFEQGLHAFFTDFLQLDDLDTLSKDLQIYPEFSTSVAASLREQTLRTIDDLVLTHHGDYRDLFTTRRVAMTRLLGPIYQVPVAEDGWTINEFPEGDPRTGLLTQASLLALHAHTGRTSPTLRGKSIRETLLCEQIPSPPANVNFAVVQDVNNKTLRTTRARLAAHLDDEECASCHKLTDPIGLGLEKFDGVGRFRAMEQNEPIDASGEFDKAHFTDAADLGRLFHDDPKIPQCLVQTAWRYAAGRSIADADKPVVDALTARFIAESYRIPALMRAIALDPALYAAAPAEHTQQGLATPPSTAKKDAS